MRTFIKVIAIMTLAFSFVACGKKTENVFVEKDGTQYEIADHSSFYYPKNFSMDTSSQNNEMISFVKDQEVISYTMIIDDTDNKVEDMPALYAGQLEEDGASDVGFKNVTVDSGLLCQEFTGYYKATGIKFKHMVYFTSEASYVLSYQAPESIYDKHIADMTRYLNSLIVQE